MSGVEVFAEVAHDLRGSLGSLRLVLTSLLDENDEEHRSTMLRLADEEAKRMAAGLAALPALAVAATDTSDPEALDLRELLVDAAAAAERLGAAVSFSEVPKVDILGRHAVLSLVLPALLVLACGIEGKAAVVVALDEEDVVLNCATCELWPAARHLVARLGEAAGGRTDTTLPGIHLLLPRWR